MDELFRQLAQYGGAAGLVAAILLYWQLRQSDRMAKALDSDRIMMVELVRNNTAAMQTLTRALDERPCIQRSHNERLGDKGQ
jgi:hypothetical protein